MSDEELEVLITIDDPWYGPDEDTFHHLQPVADWRATTRLDATHRQKGESR